MGELEGKVVLVSGVGHGVGKAISKVVLREGAKVVMGARTFKRLQAIQEEIEPERKNTEIVEADITDEKGCNALVNTALEKFGRLDALVNVAAMDKVVGNLMDGNLEDIPRVYNVNMVGTMRLIKDAVPALIESGNGSIVIIGSIADRFVVDEAVQLAYASSKAALRTATWYLARELGPKGIRVNYLAPGYMWGDVLKNAFEDWAKAFGCSTEEVMAPIRDQRALHRFAREEDVAETVSFFCSDRAAGITGQGFYIDGGAVH